MGEDDRAIDCVPTSKPDVVGEYVKHTEGVHLYIRREDLTELQQLSSYIPMKSYIHFSGSPTDLIGIASALCDLSLQNTMVFEYTTKLMTLVNKIINYNE